jgi:hypothetical protein
MRDVFLRGQLLLAAMVVGPVIIPINPNTLLAATAFSVLG